MKKTILLIVAALAILYFTNPSLPEFQTAIQEDLKEKMNKDSDEDSEGWLNFLSRPISWVVKEATVRSNFLIFSVYTVGEEPDHVVYLGILDQFVKLRESENLNLNVNINSDEEDE